MIASKIAWKQDNDVKTLNINGNYLKDPRFRLSGF